jgi:hypothetical protein
MTLLTKNERVVDVENRPSLPAIFFSFKKISATSGSAGFEFPTLA